MAAREVFDEIRKSTWEQVQAWVTEKKEESLYLDFKRRTPGAGSKLQPADRTCMSKAFSGFANVEGGVLVMGVHAAGAQKNLPDQVSEIQPIEDLTKFRNDVDRNLKSFNDPPIPGMAVDEVRDPSGDRGILVVYVPESDGGPHRVIGADSEVNDRYYMRTGTSTLVMPHSILAAMFGRAPSPKLRLALSRSSRTVNLYVGNVGRGCAESLLIRAELVRLENGAPVAGSFQDPFVFVTHVPVPGKPEMSLHSGLMKRMLYPGEWQKAKEFDLPIVDQVGVRARLYAAGMQPVKIECSARVLEEEFIEVENNQESMT
jgi:schlafen family protein